MFNTGANLFTAGDFISHAGLPLKWKIEVMLYVLKNGIV